VSEEHLREADTDSPDEREVAELLEDLEDLEETATSPEQRRVIARTQDALVRLSGVRIFGLDDVAQQVVGGFILSAPFVVTEEVWSLAAGMSWGQWAVTFLMVVAIGYGTLYSADDDRDADSEESIAGLPARFVSLVLVAYLSVTVLAVVFNAPATFEASLATTVRAISIGAIFSVIGAATADSVF
jgi:uncharacterized membrane protein